MTIYALVSENSPAHLCGLSSEPRMQRQLKAISKEYSGGSLSSWLSEDNVASGPNARSYSVFGATRGDYAQK